MIKLEHVYKEFPSKKGKSVAVKDLSMEINKGELCIFLGPSGCGKTTSLKMINRLIPATSGKIYIDNLDIMTCNQNELRRNIGYAIQNIGLFPHLTVEQNIVTVPVLKQWPKKKQQSRAAELLALVGMDPGTFLHRYPAELSGGQQQRVGVARALGADPPILLMDEPFGAIDPITRDKLQNEFLKIQEKLKKTIVFVTHDIDEAIKMGDKIALMKGGELVQYDNPAALLYSPKNEFVKNFVGSDHVLKGLRLHTVKEVMQPPALVVNYGDDPGSVKKTMEKKHLQWAMIDDRQGHFLGWINRRDITAEKKLEEILEPPVVTAETDTRLNVALSMMLKSTIGAVAVLDEEDKIEGVLSFQIIRELLGNQIESLQERE